MFTLMMLACGTLSTTEPGVDTPIGMATTDPTTPPPTSFEPGFQAGGPGFIARDEMLDTTSTVSDSDFSYAGDDWSLTLGIGRLGRGNTLTPLAAVVPELRGERVTVGSDPMFWAEPVSEGLEFGFDLLTRPPGDGMLKLRMPWQGVSMPFSTGTDVSFQVGRTQIHIDQLFVVDANGDLLPSELWVDCGFDPDTGEGTTECELAIDVDDALATYPIVVDPIIASEVMNVVQQAVVAGDQLVVTEMMFDPHTPLASDSNGEFLEITNAGTVDIDVDGLSIWDDDNDFFVVPAGSNTLLAPGETFLLGRSSNTTLNGGITVDAVISGNDFQLANGGDEVIIGIRATSDPCGPTNPCTELDRVVVDSDWENIDGDFPVGASFSLDPTMLLGDNDDPDNWCDGLSVYGNGQFGTPNAGNESCAFTLPFQYTFDLVTDPASCITACTSISVQLGTAMTTGNSGTGSYLRYTTSGGQSIEWQYDYIGPPPPTPVVYSGLRDFGVASWDNGNIDEFDPALATGGDWVSPCPVPEPVCEPPAEASLVFHQYLEGSGNTKGVEIKNIGGSSVDLDACSVVLYSNGSTSPSGTVSLSGTLAVDALTTVCHSSLGCDFTFGSIYNGDDALELVCDGTTSDVIGQIGFDPGSEWGNSTVGTQNQNLLRDCVTTPDSDGSDVFDPNVNFFGDPANDQSGSDLGTDHCP